MEEKITIERKMTGFHTVAEAVELAQKYEKEYNKIPVDKWVRCSEVDSKKYRLIAQLFKMLHKNGLAEKRIVDDGIIYIECEEWLYDFEDKAPRYLDACDKNGNVIGRIDNPSFHSALRKYGVKGKWVTCQRPIHTSHTEYRLLP